MSTRDRTETPSQRSPDVIVVGCGIVGAAVAFRLARQSRRVLCIAPRDDASATLASGAMLGVLGEIDGPLGDSTSEFRARLAAADRYDDWLAEIREAGGAELRSEPGTFVIADARRPSDMIAIDAIEAAARASGLPCERVAPGEAHGFCPANQATPGRALFLAREAHVDPAALTRELINAAVGTGCADFLDDRVSRVVRRSGRARGVQTEGHGLVEADHIVLCAGTGVQEIINAGLDDLLPRVLGGKGVGLVLEPPPHPVVRVPTHPIRTPNREFACGLHVVPREGGLYLGATNRVSRHAEITGRVTVEEVSWLLDSATKELVSSLGRWNIAGMRHGERPLASDGRPLAGATDVDGLSVATGGYRNGVLLAPLMADVVAGIAPDAAAWFSPRGRASHRATTMHANRVLEVGLRELASLMREPYGAAWITEVEAVMADAWAPDDPAGPALRAHALVLLRDYPLVPMVPEAIIEFAQAVADHDGG